MNTRNHVNCFLNLIAGDRNPVTAPERHAEIPQRIFQRWQSWGLPVETQNIFHWGFLGSNVWVPPKDPDKPFVLLMAHHDTVPNCPGLDDNGSGMAVVDAIAKMHVNDGKKLNLAFCMPDFEENDPRVWEIDGLPAPLPQNTDAFWDMVYENLANVRTFAGARRFYGLLNRRGLLGNLEVALNFDTVGYRSENQEIPKRANILKYIKRGIQKGDFVAVIGNWKARKWMRRVKRLSKKSALSFLRLIIPKKGELIPDTRRSDHVIFWDNEKPAIFFTDTANFRNPNYHRATDVEVDSKFIADIAESVYELLKKEHL